jgi:hypothetical protein
VRVIEEYRSARWRWLAAQADLEAVSLRNLAAGIREETDDYLDANERAGVAAEALEATTLRRRADRVLSAAWSALIYGLWAAVCFTAAGLTIMWTGTGIWSRVFAASNFLALWFLPDGATRWLGERTWRREAPDA